MTQDIDYVPQPLPPQLDPQAHPHSSSAMPEGHQAAGGVVTRGQQSAAEEKMVRSLQGSNHTLNATPPYSTESSSTFYRQHQSNGVDPQVHSNLTSALNGMSNHAPFSVGAAIHGAGGVVQQQVAPGAQGGTKGEGEEGAAFAGGIGLLERRSRHPDFAYSLRQQGHGIHAVILNNYVM